MATATLVRAVTDTTRVADELANLEGAEAAGAVDLFLPFAALGVLRRLRPDTSMARYGAWLAGHPGTVARRAGGLAADIADSVEPHNVFVAGTSFRVYMEPLPHN